MKIDKAMKIEIKTLRKRVSGFLLAGLMLCLAVTVGSCEDDEDPIRGCTMEGAINYDESATDYDGSCLFLGCTDPDADNYSSSANLNDGSCTYSGCTDVLASNYDASATDDDGSCTYSGCTDVLASNYDASATDDDGSCTYSGCTDVLASNYDASATDDDGSCLYEEELDIISFSVSSNDISFGQSIVLSAFVQNSGEVTSVRNSIVFFEEFDSDKVVVAEYDIPELGPGRGITRKIRITPQFSGRLEYTACISGSSCLVEVVTVE